jgi:3D (Asp-Asp-Asp) domain-containing protein
VVAVIYEWFIPMGWHTVYVPGYGHAVIADVGGGIPGEHWIDLGFPDDDYESWSRWVTVYFTLPIPPEHEILYILPMK